ERFIVGQTVDDVAGVLWPNPVGALRPWPATWIDHRSGAQREQVLVIAAVQRKIIDGLIAQRAAKRRAGRIDQRNFYRDGNDLACRTGLQSDVDLQIFAGLEQQILPLKDFESLGLHAHLIRAGKEVNTNILAA